MRTAKEQFLKQLLKTIFEPAKKNPNMVEKHVLIKLMTLFNYWSNQMEKLIAAVKIFLLTWLR